MVLDGHLLPQNDPLIWGQFDSKIGRERALDQRGAEKSGGRAERRVKLDGNVVRRKAGGKAQDIWDSELPGFCLRVLASGRKMWCVFVRERGKLRRVTLGDARVVLAKAARKLARARLAEAALDGLPTQKQALAMQKKDGPLVRDYVEQFWADYAHHWKPATQQRNYQAIQREIVPHFGDIRVDALRKSDVLFWRDGFAERTGVFNRTLPVLSVMLGYAERLGLRPRGSNPCKGTPRYKRAAKERFLSAQEYKRLAKALAHFEGELPLVVLAIRLLIYTGARKGEIENLRWEWIQPPRILLPDSKTGAKFLYCNRQALGVIDAIAKLHRGAKASGLVFPYHPDIEIPLCLDSYWPRIRAYAALPDVRLHDLRHSFASIAIQDNISLIMIGKLLGHALPETTARYAHLDDSHIADAAARVSGSIADLLGVTA